MDVHSYGDGGFHPFSLTVKVENVNELRTLWHIFNVVDSSMFANEETVPLPDDLASTFKIWKELDRRADINGQRRD
jgi:hypothetical protein